MTRITGNLHEDRCKLMTVFRRIRLRIKYILDKNFREIQHTVLCFSPKIVRFMR